MLKKIAAALVILVSFLGASAQTAKKPSVTVRRVAALATAQAAGNSQYTTYDFNWNYSPNWNACTTVNNTCWDGFIFYENDNGTTPVALGNQSVLTTALRSWSYSPTGGIPYGTHSFYVVAHGYDETGAEVTSGESNVLTLTVPLPTLAAPTNATGKYQ
jgi:hypothetical protein